MRRTDTRDPVLGARIAEGVFAAGKLWLRGTMAAPDGSGGLVAFDLGKEARTVHFASGVYDIAVTSEGLHVLRAAGHGSNDLLITRRVGARWVERARLALEPEERPLSLLDNDPLTVLTSRALHRVNGGSARVSRLALHAELSGGVQTAVTATRDGSAIYVGRNRGEWGGGLYHIDPRSGVVTDVERRDSDELCNGPLNTHCDPVTGVIRDPDNPGCVLASVGLVHLMMSHGRVLRVCGHEVTLVFARQITARGFKGNTFTVSEAFFGLAPGTGSDFWAISSGTLRRFDHASVIEEHTLPALAERSGVLMSRALPGVIVIRTDINWAMSTSGYTPLVVPIRDPA